jgi:putative nucleotidyltransferase with HDIG domain
MATRPKTTSTGSRSNGKPADGEAANGKRANGNGASGNGAHGRNGNGRVANVSLAPSTEEARRIATEMGGAMLVASSLETAQHSDDVELIADAIGKHMGLPEADRADIQAGARLHDIGKASLPRDLLDKPSTLTEAEWEVMRTHTIVGAQILGSVRELEGIAELVRHSHERWDGQGYPDGLAGDEIPLGSRIIFCADAFHAIRSDRPYRDGVSAAEALKEVHRCAGSQFDPLVVEAFEEVVRDLRLVDRPARGSKRSSRLTALLLCLALGGGGSAIGGSGLLEPDTGASEASAPPVVLDCGLLYCHSIYPSTLPGPGDATASSRSSLHGPGATLVTPAPPVTGGGPEDGSHDASLVTGPADGGQGDPQPGGGDSPAGDPPQGSNGDPAGGGSGGSGSSGGGTGPTATAPSKDKNPNSPGNGWGPPSTRPDDAPGPGNAGGNGNGQGGSAGGGSPGNSGNAPGHNKPPKN